MQDLEKGSTFHVCGSSWASQPHRVLLFMALTGSIEKQINLRGGLSKRGRKVQEGHFANSEAVYRLSLIHI